MVGGAPVTGPECYEDALTICAQVRRRHPIEWELPDELALAQVLATCALAAATAEGRGPHWDQALESAHDTTPSEPLVVALSNDFASKAFADAMRRAFHEHTHDDPKDNDTT
jgi:hypothetical protein